VKKKIGVITAAALGQDPAPDMRVAGFRPNPNAVMVAGWLYAKDFPEEVAALQAASRSGDLGTSYEVSNAAVRDPQADVWTLDALTYTGAAALRRDAAAYHSTSLAAEKEHQMTMPVTPSPTPSPNPATVAPDERLKAMVAEQMAPLRQEFSARLQAIEAALAALATRPGEQPDEMAMREQAAAFDQQADALRAKAIAKREEATALRASGSDKKDEKDGDGKDAEDAADKADDEAMECARQAEDLRLKARTLRAKAFGFLPILQAVAGLITDSEARTHTLVTDLGTKVEGVKKLITDRGGPGGAPGQGGPIQATAPPEPPLRKTLSAAAARTIGKFDNVEASGLRESQVDEALASAGITAIRERIAIKTELQRAGVLR
jgi:hypothetical protein